MEDVGGLERTAGSEPAAQRAAGHQGIDLGRRPRGDGRRFEGRASGGRAGDRSGLDRRRAGRQLRQIRGGAGAGAYRQHNGENHGGWAPHRSQAPRWAGRGPASRPQPTIVHRTGIIDHQATLPQQRARRQGNRKRAHVPRRPEMRSSKQRPSGSRRCAAWLAHASASCGVRSSAAARATLANRKSVRRQPIMRPLLSGLPS